MTEQQHRMSRIERMHTAPWADDCVDVALDPDACVRLGHVRFTASCKCGWRAEGGRQYEVKFQRDEHRKVLNRAKWAAGKTEREAGFRARREAEQ